VLTTIVFLPSTDYLRRVVSLFWQGGGVVQDIYRFRFVLLGMLSLSIASCGFRGRDARRMEPHLEPGWPKPNNAFQEASFGVLRVAMPTTADAEYVNDTEICLTCHKVYTETFQDNVHRGIHEGQACEGCHGPASRHVATRGKEPGLILSFKKLPAAEAAELCLQCHEENACAPGALWRTSVHAHNCVTCTNCHTGHYNVPPGTPATTEPGEEARTGTRAKVKLASYAAEAAAEALPSLAGTSDNMGAVAPNVCYQCHGDLYEMQQFAGPHQICGPNGFNCTTCHDAHGKILEHSRKDLCLSCHKEGSPTMAWHASTHQLYGVACTDCHNPHPSKAVQRFVNISYSDIRRPVRRTMWVQQPEACFKCHPEIFAKGALPSHHPVKEGKMVCSDCHDPHGQLEGNLKAESKNLLCWKCHAEKQGPFAYEHPPVTEDCGICHEPHGTVANNLLRQPPVFLCLRCHVGHRDGNHGGGDRINIDVGTVNPVPPGGVGGGPQLRGGFYTDCTTCHSQIHGSDLPTPHFPAMFR
jgi:DmsE family decaheme c-type cytochrome